MRFRDDVFFETMAQQLGTCCTPQNPQHHCLCTNHCQQHHACPTFRVLCGFLHTPTRLMMVVMVCNPPAGRRAGSIRAMELSSVMWALAKLNIALPPPLLAPLLKQAEVLVDTKAIDGQACSLTLWATAALSGTTTPLFRKLFKRQVEFGLTGMDPRAVQQLFQVLLLAQAESPGGDAAGRTLMKVMPPAMRREVFRMWRQQAKAVSASQFQQDVSQVLERMRIPHANEYLTEGGLFSVDIAIVGATNKVR